MTLNTAPDLVPAAKEAILTSLSDAQWHPVAELLGVIPDALAKARCEQTQPLAYDELPDPLDFGRCALRDAALHLLESEGLCESQGPSSKKELRLIQKNERMKPAVPTTVAQGINKPVIAEQPNGLPAGEAVSEIRHDKVEIEQVNEPMPIIEKPAARDVDLATESPICLVDPDLPVHEAAKIFPPPTKDEYEGIKADIQSNGQQSPGWTYQGRLLEGRTRAQIAKELGKPFRAREWNGKGSPIQFVMSLNQHRRHLSVSQRSMIAARVKELYEAEARQGMHAGKERDPRANLPAGRARDLAAKTAGVSGRSVETATKVLRQGTPELVQAVEANELSVSAAAELAGLPAGEQAAALANKTKSSAKVKESGRSKGKSSKPKAPANSPPDADAELSDKAGDRCETQLVVRADMAPDAISRLLFEHLGRAKASQIRDALTAILAQN